MAYFTLYSSNNKDRKDLHIGKQEENISSLCTICHKDILNAGIPLPKPCEICECSGYCVGCSFINEKNGKIRYYCLKHPLVELFSQ
jgi:hypothetical protein